MKKPFYLLILSVAIVALAGGCVEYEVIGNQETEQNPLDTEPVIVTSTTSGEPQTIGGDRDSHGCLVGAGYQYCPSKEKCVRDWEEDCAEIDESGLNQKFENNDDQLAASGTITYIESSDHYKQNNGSQIYVANLEPKSCKGCYDVTVNYKANVENRVLRMTATLTMEDWNITDIQLVETPIMDRSANECVDAGGRVVDTAGDSACKYQEAYIGTITDREQPNICCK